MLTTKLSIIRAVQVALLAGLVLGGVGASAEPTTVKPTVAPQGHHQMIPLPGGNLTAERLRPPPPRRDLVVEDPQGPDPTDPIPWSELPPEFAANDTGPYSVIWPCAEGFTCCSDTETDACTHFTAACDANGGHGDEGPGWATCTFD